MVKSLGAFKSELSKRKSQIIACLINIVYKQSFRIIILLSPFWWINALWIRSSDSKFEVRCVKSTRSWFSLTIIRIEWLFLCGSFTGLWKSSLNLCLPTVWRSFRSVFVGHFWLLQCLASYHLATSGNKICPDKSFFLFVLTVVAGRLPAVVPGSSLALQVECNKVLFSCSRQKRIRSTIKCARKAMPLAAKDRVQINRVVTIFVYLFLHLQALLVWCLMLFCKQCKQFQNIHQ